MARMVKNDYVVTVRRNGSDGFLYLSARIFFCLHQDRVHLHLGHAGKANERGLDGHGIPTKTFSQIAIISIGNGNDVKGLRAGDSIAETT